MLADWIKKQDPIPCYLQEIALTGKETDRVIINGWNSPFQANERQTQAVFAVLITEEVDFLSFI